MVHKTFKKVAHDCPRFGESISEHVCRICGHHSAVVNDVFDCSHSSEVNLTEERG